MLKNSPIAPNGESGASRTAGKRIRRAGLAMLLVAAVILSLLAWLLVTFLAEDAGGLRNHFGGGSGRVRLVVIEGHGRFAVCRAASTLRYLNRVFSGRNGAPGAFGAAPLADLMSERWGTDQRPCDYNAEIFFNSGAVYSGPIGLSFWRQRLLVGLPPAGLVWTQPYGFVGPRHAPSGIRKLVGFLLAPGRSLVGGTARTF